MVQITRVTEPFIKDNSIKTADYKDDSVTEPKLAEGSVTTDKLQTNAVTGNKLQDDSVTTTAISDGSVDTAQIADSSIPPSKLADTGFPIGGIIWWPDSLGNIPSGWQLCDGTNGTPDMRDLFVVGAGQDYDNLETGGSDTQTTSISGNHTHNGVVTTAGSHNHGGYTGSFTLTAAQMANHQHTWVAGINLASNLSAANQRVASQRVNGAYGDEYGLATAGSAEPNYYYSGLPVDFYGNSVSTNQSHRHVINTDGSHSHGVTLAEAGNHSHTVDVRPSYYALAAIMRIS